MSKTAERPSPPKTSRPLRRRRRRWVLVLGLGVLLAAAATWFCRTIYDPFMEGVPDPLVLVPPDADFVLSIPDFPKLAAEFSDRKFVASLDRHPGFAEFLKTPAVAERAVLSRVRDVLLELSTWRGRLPFGLDVVGDVSGRHVLVAGYTPKAPGEPFRFMVVLRPGSWLSIAGVNVLADPWLYRQFVASELQAGGTEVEHFRDTVRVRPAGQTRDFYVARVADTVLLSTEDHQLARIRKSVDVDGLPSAPAPRYRSLLPALGDGGHSADVRLLARRTVLEEQLGLERLLREEWGPEDYDLAESLVPRLGGEDLVVSLSAADGLTLTGRGDAGEDREHDVAPVFGGFPKARLLEAVADAGSLLPKDVFGMAYTEAPFEDFLGRLLRHPALVGPAERKNLEEYCAGMPRFKTVSGLASVFGAAVGDALSVAFFRQNRDALADKAAAGWVLMAPLRNEALLREVLGEMVADVRRRSDGKGLRDLVARRSGEADVWEMDLGGLVDDYRVTRPGFGMLKGRLLFTNYSPVFEDIALAAQREDLRASSNPGLALAAAYAPESLRFAVLGDLDRIFGYLEQSVPGWAARRTRVTNLHYIAWRQEFASTPGARALKPGSPEYQAQQEAFVLQKKDAKEQIDRAAVRQGFDDHLRWFRGLFQCGGVFVDDRPGSAAFRVRLDVY